MSSSEYKIRCSVCGHYSPSLLDFRCTACAQPLTVELDFPFETKKIRRKNYTVWRYTNFFPYIKERKIVSLGEGWTPLVKFSNNIQVKLENLNPTGSFKDRGSTVLISSLNGLLRKNDDYVSEDSSGNAGASIAAYAARAGLRAKVYVPENVSGPKFDQIRSYGSEVVRVSGDRGQVAKEAQRTGRHKFYVGHILHPLFRDGLRSLAYEIAEQFDWHVPERIYLPVSAGTLLLGVIKGFKHMFKSNVIESMPTIVACQTRQVSPLYHRFKGLSYTAPRTITSIADALVSTNPPLLDLMLHHLKETKGDAIMVEEDEISLAFTELAGKGFFVEPSSAIAYAAHKKQLNAEEISKRDQSVIIMTGTGLKATTKPGR